jgi:hypothetical protein
MPAEFLSAEQRAAYASFAEMPSLSDLEKFFFLDVRMGRLVFVM